MAAGKQADALKGDVGLPTTLGRYRLDRTIGQGTYGKVKIAFDVTTHEKVCCVPHGAPGPHAAWVARVQVAVKIIDKQNIENDRQVKRIQKEIRFLKLLNHPNIVKVYDVVETETHIFIVMEYAAGGELFDYIVAHKRVKEKEARVFFRQILSAVDYCHQARPRSSCAASGRCAAYRAYARPSELCHSPRPQAREPFVGRE